VTKLLYRISYHDVVGQPGWTLKGQNLTKYELRDYLKDLWDQGYTDDGIFIECEEKINRL